ncbi:hypothetical protein Tco_1024923, partial [Tanacetum coccineum]
AGKIEVVKNWKIAKPHTSLTQKNQKYEWAKEQKEAFQTLKDNLLCTHAKRQGEASKVENAIAEMLRGLDQLMERKEDEGVDKTLLDLRRL